MDMGESSTGGYWAKDTKSDARLKEVENMKDEEMSNAEPDGPPDGFQFVLPFLDLHSRFNAERLNKSLREALKDPLVWADLGIEGPASRLRLTNEILLKLVERADGHLKSLFLVDALGIRDETLSRISERNPGLERISVPGCTGLNAENFVSLVEAHSLRARAKGLPGIKQVRLRGLYSITPEHLLRLENALGVSGLPRNEASPSPRYCGNRQGRTEATDKRPVDVELCPDCQNVRLVYDCTKFKRHLKEAGCSDDGFKFIDEALNPVQEGDYDKSESCRSCRFCIPRCEECGNCIRTVSYEESLCTDLVCFACWFDLPKCNGCNRPACSRHEDDYFPQGYSELCGECHDGFAREDMSPTDAHEFDWEGPD